MRNDVELLRIISAFGIVWFHSGLEFGQNIAYSGLIVFLVLSAFFASVSAKDYAVQVRAARLLIPCALWSVLYAGVNLVRGQEIFPGGYGLISNLLSTPTIHLWYLPFIFFWVVIIDKIKKLNPCVVATVVVLTASFLLISAPIWRALPYVPPFAQYMHATPAILIGIFFAFYSRLPVMQKNILLALVLLTIFIIVILNIAGVSMTYTLGVCATLILIKNKDMLPRSVLIRGLSKLTLGIYLLHPLILFLLRHIGMPLYLLPLTAFFISALCIYVLLKIIPNSVFRYIA